MDIFGGKTMDKNELKEKLRAGMDKVVASSKKAFQKTETAVRKLSDQSVIRIEIRQFESKKKDEIKKLGELAFEKFTGDASATLSATDEKVTEILAAIKGMDLEIQTRQEKLKVLGEEQEASDSSEGASE